MKIKLSRKAIHIVSLVISMGTVVAVMGNGCSGDFKTQNIESTSTAVVANTESDDMEVIPGTKTASVVYANQVLEQMSSCLGVEKVSDSTLKMYDSKKGAISVYGAANTVNAAMMMSVISIAGEVCNDLIKQEMNLGGRIFKDINLSANQLPSDGLLTSAASRLALSCWGRPMDSSERQTVMDSIYQTIQASEAMSSQKAALMMCTSMVSSLDSLLN